MKIHGDSERDWAPDEGVSEALRSVLLAPQDDSYWHSLERRIMERIRLEGGREWWSYFPGWVRMGLAAAAVAILVAGIAAVRSQAAAERMAVEELLGEPTDIPILTDRRDMGPNASTREATLRYLISQ
jgi:anti-sigma-K factor RskA